MRRARRRTRGTAQPPRSQLLYLVVLDQRVGQELLAELVEAVGALGLQLDHPPDPNVLDALEPERGQGPLDSLALGIQDALFGPDQNPGPQKLRSVIRS